MSTLTITTTATHDNPIPSQPPPPWEVLVLISHHLDPKTLAISSSVSKSWFSCFSSDHLWGPLCSAHFPSLSSLFSSAPLHRRRLYSIAHAAHRHRHRSPRRPKLSLRHLLFGLSLHTPGGGDDKDNKTSPGPALTVVKPWGSLERDPHGLFRFDISLEEKGCEWAVEEMREFRLTWNVVVVGEGKEWKGVFTMAEEREGKGGFATSAGVDGWFSEELPPPAGMMSSGLVADLRLRMAGTEEEEGVWVRGKRCRKVRIEKISVGVISLLNWRYVSIDDALLYLEHFLPL